MNLPFIKMMAGASFLTSMSVDPYEALMMDAGWAPFHRPADPVHRQTLPSSVPWRFYLLDATACRTLRNQLDRDSSSRIADMQLTLLETLEDPLGMQLTHMTLSRVYHRMGQEQMAAQSLDTAQHLASHQNLSHLNPGLM